MKRRATAFEAVRAVLMLLVLTALVVAARGLVPEGVALHADVLLGLGLIIFAGYLTAHLGERIGLPHVTGYLLAGLLLGPHALAAVSADVVERLKPTNSIALALIALSAGAELDFGMLRRGFRSLVAAVGAHLLVVLPATFAALLALRSFVPFLAPLSVYGAMAAALLWGVIAMSRSPSSTLGVISQLRPEGPLTRHVLTVVITMDLVVLVSFAVAEALAARAFDPSAAAAGDALRELWLMLTGSLACGTTLGLLVALWLKLVKRQLLLFLLVVAYCGMQLAAYFSFQPLVLFLTAGFVVSNLTHQGEELLDLVGAGGQIVFVVFFALAGAHVDLRLLAKLWPMALTLWLVRGAATYLGARAAARIANDPPVVQRYAGLSLWSQAGTTISLTLAVGARFPALGAGFTSLGIAVAGFDELIGPLLFKWSLDRAKESRKHAQAQPLEPTRVVAAEA